MSESTILPTTAPTTTEVTTIETTKTATTGTSGTTVSTTARTSGTTVSTTTRTSGTTVSTITRTSGTTVSTTTGAVGATTTETSRTTLSVTAGAAEAAANETGVDEAKNLSSKTLPEGVAISKRSTTFSTALTSSMTTGTIFATKAGRISTSTPLMNVYDDSVFLEVSNESVGKMLLLYFIFYVMFTILLCIAICALRCHYRSKLLDELDNVRQDNEHARVYYVEAGSGARRVVPPPLSPPLTEQQVYYPLGQMLADEARRAAV